jgi:uncharacterized protein (DUF1330 family)
MKINLKMSLTLLAGIALGAIAVRWLHAQASPLAYVVVEVDVTNPDLYAKEFAPLVSKAIADGGGKFLARGGKTVSIDGAPPKSRVVLYVFNSMAQAQAAFSSPAYQNARKIGDKYATFRTFAVEGVPQ